jgi:hypothetical protein
MCLAATTGCARTSAYSSVGRAGDCRWLQLISLGHWFDSGCADTFFVKTCGCSTCGVCTHMPVATTCVCVCIPFMYTRMHRRVCVTCSTTHCHSPTTSYGERTRTNRQNTNLSQTKKHMRSPGIEPGSITWQATIITTRPRTRMYTHRRKHNYHISYTSYTLLLAPRPLQDVSRGLQR